VALLSLRYHFIVLFFVLALAPVLLFRAWPHSELLEREITDVNERHLILAQNLAASLDRYAEELTSTIGLLAGNRDFWRRSAPLGEVLKNLGIQNLCIVDRTTKRLVSGLSRGGTPCPEEFTDRSLSVFSSGANTETVEFGEVRAGQNGQNIMPIILPLSPDQVVVASIGTDHFVELGNSISFGLRGHAAIFDRRGNVLAHPRADWVEARRNIFGVSTVQRALLGESGVGLFYSPALETDMVAGFAPIPTTGWGVMVPQPIEELEAKVARVRQSTFFVLLIGVAGALVLALTASYISIRQIETLTGVARQVARGELGVPPSLRFDAVQSLEMRELYNCMRQMVTRLRQNQVRINKLAFFDTITGLPNRECFRRRVEASLEQAEQGRNAALLFIDLDGFKTINDTMGHDVGDHVLGQVGARLTELLDGDALEPDMPVLSACGTAISIARLGGDEFALFLPGAAVYRAVDLAEQIRLQIERPFLHENNVLTLGASIGIACLPDDAMDYSGLLKAADIAMYTAKHSGKNAVRVYGASPPVVRARRHDMAEDLFSCDIADQIQVYYQPVFEASDASPCAVEGLIRWDHPKYGLLAPSDFFQLVAQLGLQRQIDNLAINQAITAWGQMSDVASVPSHLSLNIPVERLQDEVFVQSVLVVLPLPFTLSFEVVETVHGHISMDQTHWAIDRLREAGVKFELDDFGSSQASIMAMLALAPHRIKLDRRLTCGVLESPDIARMVASLVDMVHAMDVEVSAKGIESTEQAKCLRDLGVDYLQGFALSRPLSATEARQYFEARSARVVS